MGSVAKGLVLGAATPAEREVFGRRAFAPFRLRQFRPAGHKIGAIVGDESDAQKFVRALEGKIETTVLGPV